MYGLIASVMHAKPVWRRRHNSHKDNCFVWITYDKFHESSATIRGNGAAWKCNTSSWREFGLHPRDNGDVNGGSSSSGTPPPRVQILRRWRFKFERATEKRLGWDEVLVFAPPNPLLIIGEVQWTIAVRIGVESRTTLPSVLWGGICWSASGTV